MVYLDGTAGKKPISRAIKTFNNIVDNNWMNPSSTAYDGGMDAHRAYGYYRDRIANMLGVDESMIFFTSGATEAINWILRCSGADMIITTEIEHPAVYNTVKYMKQTHKALVKYVPVDYNGLVDKGAIGRTLWLANGLDLKVLVAVIAMNNETGTVQQIKELSEVVHKYPNAKLFCDTTQYIAHAPVDKMNFEDLGLDFACASSQKFGGFVGSGFAFIKDPDLMAPLLIGGNQQDGLRSGTMNLWGAATTCVALEESMKGRNEAIKREYDLRDLLIKHLDKDEFVNCVAEANPSVISLTVEDCNANKLVAALGDKGIYVSAGSACSTEGEKLSRTLTSIHMLPEHIRSTIRVSLGEDTTDKDILLFINALHRVKKFCVD